MHLLVNPWHIVRILLWAIGLLVILVGLLLLVRGIKRWVDFYAQIYNRFLRLESSHAEFLLERVDGLLVLWRRVQAGIAFLSFGAILLLIISVYTTSANWRWPQSQIPIVNNYPQNNINLPPQAGAAVPPVVVTQPAAAPVDYTPAIGLGILMLGGIALLIAGTTAPKDEKRAAPIALGVFVTLLAAKPLISFTLENVIRPTTKLSQSLTTEPVTKDLYGAVSLKRIALIENFPTGQSDPEGADPRSSSPIRFYNADRNPMPDHAKLYGTVCDQHNGIFIVGRTDRVRLGSSLRTQHDSNVGLAQARAEAVRERIEETCKDQGKEPPSMFTQVAGPRDKSPAAYSRQYDPKKLANDNDRSVEILALQQSLETIKFLAAVDTEPHGHATLWPGWIPFVVILILALVAGTLISDRSIAVEFHELKVKFETKK